MKKKPIGYVTEIKRVKNVLQMTFKFDEAIPLKQREKIIFYLNKQGIKLELNYTIEKEPKNPFVPPSSPGSEEIIEKGILDK